MDAKALLAKMEWEGGVFDLIDYGIRADQIDDPAIAAMWQDAVDHWTVFSALCRNIEELVERKAGE
jgi:hypothetical protein